MEVRPSAPLSRECVDVLDRTLNTLHVLSPDPDLYPIIDEVDRIITDVRAERSVEVRRLLEVQRGLSRLHKQFGFPEDAKVVLQWCRRVLRIYAGADGGSVPTTPFLVRKQGAIPRSSHDQQDVELQELPDDRANAVVFNGCPKMAAVEELATRFARPDINVLVQGPTGSGKEAIAHRLHRHSRKNGTNKNPIGAINCCGLTETLIQSELFGHRKGAFTGADHDRTGLFAACHRGTLFLDEIDGLPIKTQGMLLRTLQEGTVMPLGSDQSEGPFDVKVVSATNKDLPSLVQLGEFRSDLFYRLCIGSITLPSFHERHKKHKKAVIAHLASITPGTVSLSKETEELLISTPLVGNIRALKNLILIGSVLAGSGNTIAVEHLRDGLDLYQRTSTTIIDNVRLLDETQLAGVLDVSGTLTESVKTFQITLITAMIDLYQGNMTRVAERFGVHRSNLYRKMRLLGMRADA